MLMPVRTMILSRSDRTGWTAFNGTIVRGSQNEQSPAQVTKKIDAKTLQKFVADSAAEGATVSLNRINNQVSQSLRYFWYQPVPNHLTTNSLRLRPFSYNVIK